MLTEIVGADDLVTGRLIGIQVKGGNSWFSRPEGDVGWVCLSPQEMTYLRAYLQHAIPSPRTPLLLRALFETAVGTVEPLVTRLVRLLLFHCNAGQYLSLADPKLDKTARNLCYGPPGKGRDTFAELGVDGAALVAWASLERLTPQRRHGQRNRYRSRPRRR